MKSGIKTVIDLSGIDLDSLTPDNFREVTRAAGKNPGPQLNAKGQPHKMAGVPRGYRLRIPANIASRTEGTVTNSKTVGNHDGVMTREDARWARLREIIAEFRTSQTPATEASNV